MNPIAETVAADMRRMVRWAAHHTGRSQQADLGPSEIGHPCDRRLVYRMAGAPRRRLGEPLPALIGTGGHAALQAAAHAWEGQDPDDLQAAELDPDDPPAARAAQLAPYRHNPRYLAETHVDVPGLAHGGTVDLYDLYLSAVIDHKWVSAYRLDQVRRYGPPETYVDQAHTYALGWESTFGRIPEHVVIVFWPRESSDRYGSRAELDYVWAWSEPYDPGRAVQALERVDALRARAEGVDLRAHPELAGAFDATPEDCRFCPYFNPYGASLSFGCPGQ